MRHLLILFCISFYSLGFSQNFVISLAPSVSLPQSEYGSTELSDSLSNFADLGIGGSVEMTLWFHPAVGISFIAGGYSNKLDNTAFAQQISDEFSLDLSVTEENYTNIYAMLGLALGYNSKKFSISVHPTVGYGVTSALDFKAFSEELNADISTFSLEDDAGLMYGVQLSTKFFLNKTVGLGFNAGYISGNFEQIGFREEGFGIVDIKQEFKPTAIQAGINLSFRIGGGGSQRHRPGAGFYFGG